MLDASKDEATLAVRLYNDPKEARSLEGFIIHMHIAWLYLFQAKWTKAGKEKAYRRRESDKPLRYARIDGEYVNAPLDWFVRAEYPSGNDPVRANLDFFVKLRNKIEHRHSGAEEVLQSIVSGECHSLLLNYEEALVTAGGIEQSLANVLRFPVFIGGFTDKGKADLLRMTKALPATLRTFLAEYDNTLDDEVARDPKYCMRLTILLERGNRKGDIPIQFFNMNELSDDERELAEKLAGRGMVIKHTKAVNVSNDGNLKPAQVVAKVQAAVPFTFNQHHFTQAYKINKVRPGGKSDSPAETRKEWCIWDAPHGDYTYTPAYVDWLIKRCSTEAGFEKTTGRPARPRAKP